jgi:cytochrome c oxidase assembly protein subunit 15
MIEDREARTQQGFWLALGFATAITMWAVGYVGRLPAVMAPSWLILIVMLAGVGYWGWQTGRRTGRGWQAGASVGATAAVLNMLILGSLLGSAEAAGGVRPSALWWIPGSIVVVAVLAGGAAVLGARIRGDRPLDTDFGALFTKVAVAATFLLIVAGGLVTSQEAGLAVVDWPNTFGTNMFLYPISRMTGGVFYEHAHRLFGVLVGLTTVAVAVFIVRTEHRRWVRWIGAAAVVMVVVQGVLGGLRVTGRFTLSASPEETAPSIALAVVHGVVGQLFLGLMVALAVVTSRTWAGSGPAEQRPASSGDRSLQSVLVALLLVQLIFGAVQRHVAQGLLIHITLAAAVTAVAIVAGARAWGLYHGVWPVQRLGQLVMAAVSVQVALGIAALAVTQGRAVVGDPTAVEVTIATSHQATGAALLAVSVMLAMWTRRLFSTQVG